MNSFADCLVLEEKWIDALFRFRIYFPSEDPARTTAERIQHNSVDVIRIPETPEEIVASIALPNYSLHKSTYGDFALKQTFTERLFLALASLHKFNPGCLDRKIHHYFFSNPKEPASVIRNILGISPGAIDRFVPTINFLTYIHYGNNLPHRIELLRDIHHGKIGILRGDHILLGERDLAEPLFSNAFLLSDELAIKFLE